MARGRKKQEIHKESRVISFRISLEEYEIIKKNPFLKKDLKKEIEHYLSNFAIKKDHQ